MFQQQLFFSKVLKTATKVGVVGCRMEGEDQLQLLIQAVLFQSLQVKSKKASHECTQQCIITRNTIYKCFCPALSGHYWRGPASASHTSFVLLTCYSPANTDHTTGGYNLPIIAHTGIDKHYRNFNFITSIQFQNWNSIPNPSWFLFGKHTVTVLLPLVQSVKELGPPHQMFHLDFSAK